MQYTLVAWMRDRPGVLNRVSGMLRRRNFNIDSLQVSHSETPGISRMTFVVDGDERVADQVVKQLRKVVDVTAVDDITNRLAILRELALIRVRTTPETRGEILQFAEIFRAQIVDVNTENLVVQAVGTEDKIDSLIDLMRPFGIEEMVRTGRVALRRGDDRPRRKKPSTSIFNAAASLNGSGHDDQE